MKDDLFDEDLIQIESINYDIFAELIHTRTVDKGHYYSYIKNNNNIWLEFNDKNLMNLNNSIKNFNYVYSLFYKRSIL